LGRKAKFRVVLDEATIEALHKMAPLHDVGKIGIRDAILLKPGGLSADEFEEMKKHTVIGHQVFRAAAARLGTNSFLRIADGWRTPTTSGGTAAAITGCRRSYPGWADHGPGRRL
jgi:hypothetical protein